MTPRVRVALVYGGRSDEHPISVVSAGSVLGALDPERYDIVTVGITLDGRWVRGQIEAGPVQLDAQDLPQVIGPAAGESGLVRLFGPESAAAALDDVDVVFPVLHGAYGEDGTIQGLLEMAGVAYVGSGVLASAAAMDKVFTKMVLAAAGLDVGRYLVLRKGEQVFSEDIAELGYPVFVKPARSGSSVGITKVAGPEQLADALSLAFRHDCKAIVEAAVTGREVECGVLQDADGSLSASVPAEIRLRAGFDWYSFDAKYLDDACDFDIPPSLPADAIKALQDCARNAFEALECSGLARVDFFIRPDGSIVVNEVNTMPGFTPISMYPRMWAASGVTYSELIDRLIATALARTP